MPRGAATAPRRPPQQRSRSIIVGQWRTTCHGPPPTFRSDEDAVRWAVGQGIDKPMVAQKIAELRRQHNRQSWAYFLAWAATQMRG